MNLFRTIRAPLLALLILSLGWGQVFGLVVGYWCDCSGQQTIVSNSWCGALAADHSHESDCAHGGSCDQHEHEDHDVVSVEVEAYSLPVVGKIILPAPELIPLPRPVLVLLEKTVAVFSPPSSPPFPPPLLSDLSTVLLRI